MYYKIPKATKSKSKSWSTPHRGKNSAAHKNAKGNSEGGRDAMQKSEKSATVHAKIKVLPRKKTLKQQFIKGHLNRTKSLINGTGKSV